MLLLCPLGSLYPDSQLKVQTSLTFGTPLCKQEGGETVVPVDLVIAGHLRAKQIKRQLLEILQHYVFMEIKNLRFVLNILRLCPCFKRTFYNGLSLVSKMAAIGIDSHVCVNNSRCKGDMMLTKMGAVTLLYEHNTNLSSQTCRMDY